MSVIERPRVALIGLDDNQVESIAGLCGDPRPYGSLELYLRYYNLAETDFIVSAASLGSTIARGVHVLSLGPTQFSWWFAPEPGVIGFREATTSHSNTEREVTVPPTCPLIYENLAHQLTRKVRQSEWPPPTISTSQSIGRHSGALVETTSNHPVALRLVLGEEQDSDSGERCPGVALILPDVDNLAAWFRAFLADIHEIDPEAVPHKPPRSSSSGVWNTQEEEVLAKRIACVTEQIADLRNEREGLQAELKVEAERADRGIRRAIWADGSGLVEAVVQILSDLGFIVREMDDELEAGQPKHEDLRLTLNSHPDWEAIVEVKGYTSGTKTNDAQQIRKYREHYQQVEGEQPALTLWISNPFRGIDDPFSRPTPDSNVQEVTQAIGAVYVSAPDLYLQWTRVARGEVTSDEVLQSLLGADPGIWEPSSSC